MGEIPVEVDVTQLRGVADQIRAAADRIAELRFPGLDPDELRGSAVGGITEIVAPILLAARIEDLVAHMHGWAVAARMSADAFERTEEHNLGRFDRP
jgi:hypothetical protein